MKKLTAVFAFFLCCINSKAQDDKIEINVQRQANNAVEFSYKKSDPGSYTVVFNFFEYTNTDKPQDTYTIEGVYGNLMTLKPKDPAQGIGYRFNYRYVRGRLKPKIQKAFCYLMPYNAGTACQVVEAGFANERYFGAKKPDDWKSYLFATKAEEMVTAIRKGTVVETIDQYDDISDVEFTTKKNAVVVEHEDGTLVRYLGFKKGSLKVKQGDIVFPGKPLGLNTPFSNGRFGLSIFIYYLTSVDFASVQGQTLATPKSLYSILTPKFLIAEGACTGLENQKDYVVFSNEASIIKEMSKKELKKFKEK